MRTTIDIDADLLEKARQRAAEEGRTVDEFLERTLRDAFSQSALPSHEKLVLPVFTPPPGREGLLPGVDLDRSSELLEVMSGPDAPA